MIRPRKYFAIDIWRELLLAPRTMLWSFRPFLIHRIVIGSNADRIRERQAGHLSFTGTVCTGQKSSGVGKDEHVRGGDSAPSPFWLMLGRLQNGGNVSDSRLCFKQPVSQLVTRALSKDFALLPRMRLASLLLGNPSRT